MSNSTTDDQLALVIGSEAGQELQAALKKIFHCLNQLTDEQIWWRLDESQNSIGNLVLHLSGNLRQWVVSGLGGIKDERNRPREFSERRPIPRAKLSSQIESVVSEAAGVLSSLTASELLRIRRIQGFDVSGVAAVFKTVPHFRGHTQEIIYRTRILLGQKYVFDWHPTPEQGASA